MRRSTFARNAVETYFTQIGIFVFSFVTGVLSARTLGVEGRGAYAVALVVGNLGTHLGNAGLHAANTFFVSRRPNLLPRLVANSAWYACVAGTAIALVSGSVIAIWPSAAPVTGTLLILAILWIPVNLFYLSCSGLQMGLQRIRLQNKIELSLRAATVATVIAVTIFGALSPARFLAIVLAGFAGAALVSARTFAVPMSQMLRPSISVFKETLPYGAKIFGGSLFIYVALRFDLLMVEYLLGRGSSGHYSITASMGDIILTLPASIAAVLFPTLSKTAVFADRWENAKKASGVMAVVMAVVCLGGFLAARPVIVLAFGEAFSPAVSAFRYLVPGLFFMSISVVFGSILSASGMPIYALLPSMMAAVLNIGLNFVLIPSRGIDGAAIASTISYIACFVVTIAMAILFRYRVELGERRRTL